MRNIGTLLLRLGLDFDGLTNQNLLSESRDIEWTNKRTGWVIGIVLAGTSEKLLGCDWVDLVTWGC